MNCNTSVYSCAASFSSRSAWPWCSEQITRRSSRCTGARHRRTCSSGESARRSRESPIWLARLLTLASQPCTGATIARSRMRRRAWRFAWIVWVDSFNPTLTRHFSPLPSRIPLPGGYGSGSQGMADWIRIMMHRDVDLLKTGKIKPSDTYPPAFGAPPRIETRDIKPLPFGYGQGSSTNDKSIRLSEYMNILDTVTTRIYNGSQPQPTERRHVCALSCQRRVRDACSD